MAIAAFTTLACWVAVEWCLCFSLEKQRDKSHSRSWSIARFSGLSRILNHKATLSGSFIPLFADTPRMKPIAQKQPGVQLSLQRVRGDLSKAFTRQDLPLHNRALNSSCPDTAKLSGICFVRSWSSFRKPECWVAQRDFGSTFRPQALFTGKKHRRTRRVGRAREHHQRAALMEGDWRHHTVLELPAYRISGII